MAGPAWRPFAFAGFLALGLVPPGTVGPDRFPAPWAGQNSRLVDLVQSERAADCTHYAFRPERVPGGSRAAPAAFLLACSPDGGRWSFFRVYPDRRDARRPRLAPPRA